MLLKSQIETILAQQFAPLYLSVTDEGLLHQAHSSEVRAGQGHYKLVIVSLFFEGKSLIERHRAIYDALNMQVGEEIHALAIQAFEPHEWLQRHKNV